MQNSYGMDPATGAVAELATLRHLDDAQRETARILRATLAHYSAGGLASAEQALERIVREQAFTVLNRLLALRMAEARGLLTQSVGNGYQAEGFQLYHRLAGSGLGETGDAYRIYLFSVFDELTQALPALFDRYAPQGRLFPREPVLLQLLDLINDGELEQLWAEDEAIGWVYQYFNSSDERKAMRKASSAPRNSRELAVRNQFFTPRYVVEFLVDNTLGRLWFNATGGQTALRERCKYLLVGGGQSAESSVNEDSGQALLPVSGESPDSLRDPRTLKLLDPACGSMHFGLYAFDLFEQIYREAWEWEEGGGQNAEGGEQGAVGGEVIDGGEELSRSDCLAAGNGPGGSGLSGEQELSAGGKVRSHQSNPARGSIDSLQHRRGTGAPHGGGFCQVSVDSARVAARGGNATEHRAEAALHNVRAGANNTGHSSRGGSIGTGFGQQTERSLEHTAYSPLHSVYPSKAAFLRDVPRLIIEHNIYGVEIDPRAAQIASLALWLRAQRAWHEAGIAAKDRPAVGRGNVIAATAPPAEKQLREQFAATLSELDAELFEKTLQLLKGVPELGVLLQAERELPRLIKTVFGEHGPMFSDEDADQWAKAEARLRQALIDFTRAAQASYQGRLFASDALQGLRLIDLTREVFDVVVMNPPFGALAAGTKTQLGKAYPRSKNDLLAIFVERGLELLRTGGRVGAITSRTCFFLSSYRKWREEIVLGIAKPEVMADLGHGVMDDAMVEAAAYVLEKQ